MSDDATSRTHRFETTAVAEAMTELFVCAAEIDDQSLRLEILETRLLAEPPLAGEPSGLRHEVHVTIGCLLDHLRPAREVVRRFQRACRVAARASELMAEARDQMARETADHLVYQWYLAGIEGDAVQALRHLFHCPLCEKLTRAILFGSLVDPGSSHAGGHPLPVGAKPRRRKRSRRGRRRSEIHPPSERK